MTIDERIQALTESVELLASFHRDTEAELRKLSANVDTIAQLVNGQSPQ